MIETRSMVAPRAALIQVLVKAGAGLAEPEPATHIATTRLAALPVPVVVPDGEFGDTVMYDLEYTVDANGVWLRDTPVRLRLMIGEQFCSDAANAQACTST